MECKQDEIDALRRALKEEGNLVKKLDAEINRLREILDYHDIDYIEGSVESEHLQ